MVGVVCRAHGHRARPVLLLCAAQYGRRRHRCCALRAWGARVRGVPRHRRWGRGCAAGIRALCPAPRAAMMVGRAIWAPYTTTPAFLLLAPLWAGYWAAVQSCAYHLRSCALACHAHSSLAFLGNSVLEAAASRVRCGFPALSCVRWGASSSCALVTQLTPVHGASSLAHVVVARLARDGRGP